MIDPNIAAVPQDPCSVEQRSEDFTPTNTAPTIGDVTELAPIGSYVDPALAEDMERVVDPLRVELRTDRTEGASLITIEYQRQQKARHAARSAIGRTHDGFRKSLGVARELGWRGAIRGVIVAAEINPLSNEVPRYGALYTMDGITHGNPWIGAGVLGGGTLVVEGAGALAAAGLVTTRLGGKAIEWTSRKINKKINKFVPPDAKLSSAVTFGVATTLGTPILMGAQQRENPRRNEVEARKQGLRTVAWMTGLFAIEGAAISKGIGAASGLPEKLGAGALGTAATIAIPSWINKTFERRSKESLTREPAKVIGSRAGGNIPASLLNKSTYVYEAVRDREDEEVHIGLYGEDLMAALNNPQSELLEYVVKDKKRAAYYMPILVPAEALKWYNMDLLKKQYGQDTQFYYYAHPSLPDDADSRAIIASALEKKLETGAVIFTDSYRGDNSIDLSGLVDGSDEACYTTENLGGGETERTGVVFTAPVTFNAVEEVKAAPSMYEVWQQSIEDGEIVPDSKNGVAVLQTIEGDEADRIWEIYKNPFKDLSTEHPMNAGFDETELRHILSDPGVAKVVNRVDGRISTLCFFVQDFDQCPWFNRERYRKLYPEYYKTDNIFIFPGIVTDENMRGNDYALDVIDLTVKLLAKRGTNILVTFECTETSATYIPTIVAAAINNSGEASVQEEAIATPRSITDYNAIRA